ncbi:MAG: pyridoxal-phosphate dependent enzyme [Planctomycetota bacterium]
MKLSKLQHEIQIARGRTDAFLLPTPLIPSDCYSELTGANVMLKYENLQRSGSFKFRGVMNKCLAANERTDEFGFVAASTGNHGKALALAGEELGLEVIVFAPENAAEVKLQDIRSLGAEVRIFGQDCVEAELEARRFSEQNSVVYVSPYNDPLVIAGQGTIGEEIIGQPMPFEQLKSVDAVIGSLGGGGLICGVGASLKRAFPKCEVVACSPENSNVMIQSLEQGKILNLPSKPTLSEGTAGGVEQDSVTFPLCQKLLTDTISVTEDEIIQELRRFYELAPDPIEGAAATALAGLVRNKERWVGKNVIVIICGGNISEQTLLELGCGVEL